MLYGMPLEDNKQTCTKIPYKGFEISIAMDSSHSNGDLCRSDIRVFSGSADMSSMFYPQADCSVIIAHAENLKMIFAKIDEIVGRQVDPTAI